MDNTNAGRKGPLGSYDEWIDRDLYDSAGEKVGGISDIYYDDMTGRPEWVAVKTGLMGMKSNFVPISEATIMRDDDGDEHLQVRFSKDQISEAPAIDADGELTPAQEQDLYSHYGFDWKGQGKSFGYEPQGKAVERADRDYAFRRFDRQSETWSEAKRSDEHVDTVPVSTTAQVEVPVEAQVRLRRYQTQTTRNVPVTETSEHVEVADVDAKAKGKI